MDKLRIVSIGGFGHAVCVFDELERMSQAELVGLSPAFCGEDIQDFKNHPICKNVPVYDDYHQMIKETSPAIAIISTRLDMIPTVAIEAAEMGCHLLCEKPLAIDHNNLNQLYNTVKKTGVKLNAMLSMRSFPAICAAKQAYVDGMIGEAVVVNGRKSYKWGVRPEWFGNREFYGGSIGWVGIHAFDMINYITGLEVTSIAALQRNFGHPERIDCEDSCSLCFNLSNGGNGTISVDLFRPTAASTWGDDWVRIVGTKGVLEASNSAGKCSMITEKGAFELALPPAKRIFEEFILSVLDDRATVADKRTAFLLTDIGLCGRRSAETGKFVQIETGKWVF